MHAARRAVKKHFRMRMKWILSLVNLCSAQCAFTIYDCFAGSLATCGAATGVGRLRWPSLVATPGFSLCPERERAAFGAHDAVHLAANVSVLTGCDWLKRELLVI